MAFVVAGVTGPCTGRRPEAIPGKMQVHARQLARPGEEEEKR